MADKIEYIISGGQSGVERAALDIAIRHKIAIKGWCAQNGFAEDFMKAPGILSKYPMLKEVDSEELRKKNELNIRDSHITLIVLPDYKNVSPGTITSINTVKMYDRPHYIISDIPDMYKVANWIDDKGYGLSVNITGPKESEYPGAYDFTLEAIDDLLNMIEIKCLDNIKKQIYENEQIKDDMYEKTGYIIDSKKNMDDIKKIEKIKKKIIADSVKMNKKK